MKTLPTATAVIAVLALAGCSGSSSPARSSSSSAASSSGSGTVVVLAAASLAGPMKALVADYEQAHPGVTVKVTTGGSSDLVTQLAGGLEADVLATADQRTMTQASDQSLVTAPATKIATNSLTLVTAPGNPLKITDLASAGTHDLVVCAEPVPCGAATKKLAAATGTTVHAKSEEQNVTAVLEKVTSGQADAGVVYVTDAKKAGAKVTAVALPGADKAINTYMAAITPNASANGRDFFSTLTGTPGRAALAAAGFVTP